MAKVASQGMKQLRFLSPESREDSGRSNRRKTKPVHLCSSKADVRCENVADVISIENDKVSVWNPGSP